MDATDLDARTSGDPARPEVAPGPTGEEEAARGLLVGLLAAQVGLVERGALLGAVRAWAAARPSDLGAILLERGAIDDRRLDLLRTLVRLTLEQNGDDPARAIATLDPPDSTLRALREVFDEGMQATFDGLGGPRTADGAPGLGTTVDGPIPASTTDRDDHHSGVRRGRYRIIRFHARGGLGKVSVAIDDELNRQVALKEIREDYSDDPESRSSFVYEAEVTGHLEHPGVVPVYGFGRDQGGRPYYAMRFIRGETLEAAVKAFHGPGGPPAGGRRALEMRRLLRRFIDVCNAIEYAHSRGVIHRDLKPSNILLGPHGETLIVDWGLAKPVGRPEGGATGEETIRPSSGSDHAASRYGSVKGTPAYMSPEQSEGRVDELTSSSDVYAMGATLYEILAGVRAFPGRDKDEILAKVRAGDFVPPRQVAPTVPKPLEAVCLKAMALRPEGRHASAEALAEDVERWLADEPVAAYREPLPARAGRWLRRHRTAAVAAVVLLVVATAGLAIDDVRVARERAETVKALDLAKEEGARAASEGARATSERNRAEGERKQAVSARNRANVSFGLARDAVDQIEAVVAGPALTASAEEDRLRHKLAEIALGFYEKLLAVGPGDGLVRFRLARVAREAANLGRLAGRFDEPLRQYNKAVALLEGLEARAPEEPAYHFGLAATFKDLGELYQMNGRPRDADGSFRRALEALGRVVVKPEQEPIKRRELGMIQNNLAAVLIARGDYPEARRAADQAVDAIKGPDLDTDLDRMLLVMALTTRGRAARVAKDLRAAEEALREADRAARALLVKDPGHRDYRFFLASVCDERGWLLALDPARRAGAVASFDEAARLLEPLAKAFPHVSFYTRGLASALDGRGATLLEDGRTVAAARDCRAAVDLLEGLLKTQGLPANHGGLGRALGDLARVARAEGKPDEAAALLDRAIAEQGAALAGNRESLADLELLDRHKADLADLKRPGPP